MDRRDIIKGAAAVATGAYIWVPKIVIGQIRETDPRDAFIKGRTVVVNNFGDEMDKNLVADSSGFRDAVPITRQKLNENRYSRAVEHDRSTRFIRSGDDHRGYLAAYREDKNYCHAYMHHTYSRRKPVAYLSSISFLCHSRIIEKAGHLTSSRKIALLYPNTYCEAFEDTFQAEIRPTRVICEEGIWSVTYSPAHRTGYSGTAKITLLGNSNLRKIYEEIFDINIG